jgi:hypothetical protein
MKKLVVASLSIVVVVVIAWFVYGLLQKKTVTQAFPVPTSCPAPKAIECPSPGDVDANGCPTGGYDSSKGECLVTFEYYKKYAGCKDDTHHPMAFYTKASPGNPSKYHLVGPGVLDVQAAFTEIDCTSHVPAAAVNAGKPFLHTIDDFSSFKHEHVSDDADPAAIGKCFKVMVNPSIGDCIDPHIIIRRE